LADVARGFLDEGNEATLTYLRESWIAATMALMRRARLDAGLTQEEIAGRMGTHQPHIARLERADDTKLSTLWEYLHACGQAPLAIETTDSETMRRFVHDHPEQTATADAVRRQGEAAAEPGGEVTTPITTRAAEPAEPAEPTDGDRGPGGKRVVANHLSDASEPAHEATPRRSASPTSGTG